MWVVDRWEVRMKVCGLLGTEQVTGEAKYLDILGDNFSHRQIHLKNRVAKILS